MAKNAAEARLVARRFEYEALVLRGLHSLLRGKVDPRLVPCRCRSGRSLCLVPRDLQRRLLRSHEGTKG